MAYTPQQQAAMQQQYTQQMRMQNAQRLSAPVSTGQMSPMHQAPSSALPPSSAMQKPTVDSARLNASMQQPTQRLAPMQQPTDDQQARMRQQMQMQNAQRQRANQPAAPMQQRQYTPATRKPTPGNRYGMQNRNSNFMRTQAYQRYARGMGM